MLGVGPNASVSDIKQAYYKLAMAHHPDTSNVDSAHAFAEIGEAYRTLLAQQATPAKETLTVDTLR